jgi:membrane protein
MQSIVANAETPSAGIMSGIVGIIVLLFGASGVFGELQSALNAIWKVEPKPGRGIRGMIRDRFFSVTMVLVRAHWNCSSSRARELLVVSLARSRSAI